MQMPSTQLRLDLEAAPDAIDAPRRGYSEATVMQWLDSFERHLDDAASGTHSRYAAPAEGELAAVDA